MFCSFIFCFLFVEYFNEVVEGFFVEYDVFLVYDVVDVDVYGVDCFEVWVVVYGEG